MHGERRGLPPIELEVFGASLGGGLVAGALSIVVPFLNALTGTLAALALAGWSGLVYRRGESLRAYLSAGGRFAFPVLVVGTLLYLRPPVFLEAFRGLVLALSLVPFWWVERCRSVGRPPTTGRG